MTVTNKQWDCRSLLLSRGPRGTYFKVSVAHDFRKDKMDKGQKDFFF